jgi:phosphate starvation-inducible PhoH-like protein
MIKNIRTKFKSLPMSSKKMVSVFFIDLDKNKYKPMSKKSNSYLHLIDNEEPIIVEKKSNKDVLFNKKQHAEFLLKKVNVKCKNEKQKEFIHSIDANEITICIGDSGVGKSYVSLAKALELFKNGNYEKIYIITPIIETENENIGFLKGTLEEKLSPYLYSIYYLIDKIVGEETRKKLVDSEIIEPLCISFLRGTNIDNSILIADESQNITIKGIKTLLTRIGFNSKFIISGDINQIDRFKKPEDSGLKFIYDNLKDVANIGFVEFGINDIVRNPIIGEILNRFN